MSFRDSDSSLFSHCPACGLPQACPERRADFRCGACGFRLFFNVAAAAGVFLLDPDGRALFVRRAHEPAKGKLGIPGGFVDPGEPVEAAVAREAAEEVGLAVGRLDFLCSFPNRYEFAGVRYHTVDLFFRAETAGLDAAAPSAEVSEIVLARPSEIDPEEIAFGSIRFALERLAAPA
jgi:ADP-ribose pyrophosphatase YjhB (NUDIX family)